MSFCRPFDHDIIYSSFLLLLWHFTNICVIVTALYTVLTYLLIMETTLFTFWQVLWSLKYAEISLCLVNESLRNYGCFFSFDTLIYQIYHLMYILSRPTDPNLSLIYQVNCFLRNILNLDSFTYTISYRLYAFDRHIDYGNNFIIPFWRSMKHSNRLTTFYVRSSGLMFTFYRGVSIIETTLWKSYLIVHGS